MVIRRIEDRKKSDGTEIEQLRKEKSAQQNKEIATLKSSLTKHEKSYESTLKELVVSKNRVAELETENQALKNAPVVPDRIQISKVGKPTIDGSIICIACKVRIGEITTYPTILCGSKGAFNGLSQKADQIEESTND